MNTASAWTVTLVAAHLIGTFPSAVWIARRKGVDITTVGSGNPGAANIARTLGTPWGVLVFVLDGLKGAVPGLAGIVLDGRALGWAAAGAATLGHMFPATRRFRGGKGVATVGGACLAMSPLPALGMLGLWIVVRRLTGTASLASLAIMVAFPVTMAVIGVPAWELLAIIALVALVVARHSGNIRRLLDRRELSASRAP